MQLMEWKQHMYLSTEKEILLSYLHNFTAPGLKGVQRRVKLMQTELNRTWYCFHKRPLFKLKLVPYLPLFLQISSSMFEKAM